MDTFDISVYHWLNYFAGHYPILDAIMAFFAQYALELYALLLLIAWFTLPRHESKTRHALVVSVIAAVFALIINVIIGHIWVRPRPFAVLPKGSFTQLIPHSSDASFPSDHTSGSFALASATWRNNTKWISWCFTVLAVLVMIARVYCGVHWPTDVIGGFIIGTISGRYTWKLTKFIRPITNIGLKMFHLGEFAPKDDQGSSTTSL